MDRTSAGQTPGRRTMGTKRIVGQARMKSLLPTFVRLPNVAISLMFLAGFTTPTDTLTAETYSMKIVVAISVSCLVAWAATIAAPTIAVGQGGSVGGRIGKTDKSATSATAPASRSGSSPKSTPDRSSCGKAVGVWFWVTMEVTIKPGGVVESPGGNGRWLCKDGQLDVIWDGTSRVESFQVTDTGQLTGHWFIKPRRLR